MGSKVRPANAQAVQNFMATRYCLVLSSCLGLLKQLRSKEHAEDAQHNLNLNPPATCSHFVHLTSALWHSGQNSPSIISWIEFVETRAICTVGLCFSVERVVVDLSFARLLFFGDMMGVNCGNTLELLNLTASKISTRLVPVQA